MPLSERAAEDALHDHARALQQELGIDQYFLENLYKEPDDWSFVVKLNALIEAALTHLLVEDVGRAELRDAFANTELANAKTGKIAFAYTLGLIGKEERRFIQKLAEARNAFVHDVRRVGMSIPDFTKALKVDQRNEFFKAIRYFAPAGVTSIDFPDHPGVNVERFVVENQRLAVWFSAMNLVAVLYVHKTAAADHRALQKKIQDVNAVLAGAVAKFLEPAALQITGHAPTAIQSATQTSSDEAPERKE